MIFRLIIVRHGESYGNLKRIYQGSIDKYGLTEKGKKQSYFIGERIKKYKPSIVISSPLKRAYETANCILEILPKAKTYYISKLVKELNLGKLEGKNKDYVKRRYKDEFEILKKNDYDYSIFCGETLMSSKRRAKEVIKQLSSLDGETALIITHGGFMRILLDELLDNDIKEYSCKNGCIYILERNNHKYELLKQNIWGRGVW
ncbi:histidine phosphatase family protein [Abyssisolibacter fermentans]|uniref:histidine phosphatase family protein n=1 Tax=Abyssisolibacter fermentans TaxID=1766203 RepID=UPI00082E92BA|nr:histidine phosphatase family protein [Abyssisolibacter fermentans]